MGFDWGIFGAALFGGELLRGAALTVALAALSMTVALLAAIPLAAIALSGGRAARAAIGLYVWFFRGAPALLVLLFVWNGLPQIFGIFRQAWFTPFLAAFLALTLIGVAYLAEVMRGAFLAVPDGQRQAAAALGLHRRQTLLLVVLPQAVRIALPPLINEFVSLLKTTSLAMVISLREMMTVASFAISSSFRFLEWYGAALLYYLALVSAVMAVQAAAERRLGRAYRPAAAAGATPRSGA
jgi:His/Glu/Gln/Arg/opine family amino acid ABC transporter permease subunit